MTKAVAAISHPFKSKFNSGHCPFCEGYNRPGQTGAHGRIKAGDVIVKIEKVSWCETRHGNRRAYSQTMYAEYAHAECLTKYNNRQT